ncbi:MAG: aminotransferase class V-fold PLP-dependent enzyme [Clostridiales bacterium]|nr:aminotransferase class V-fold PLP-dependent enzyme [Clostridiales bacterium]
MQENYLDEALTEYGRSDYYPFHMPGHKRQRLGDFLPEEIDITEIEGFDNLHHAEGILREGQERLARLFGADESFYLVNGSTAGILAAVCGCIRKGDRILIGRNCHKAVYHAAYLMEAKAEYLYPEPTDFGIQGSIAPGQVEKMLAERKDVRAVVITSPTYDGVVSDIRAIAEIVHGYGIPLIVDEAHGAHFGFSEGFPQKAIALGADLCVESLHKTLPSYTQTAVLHMMRGDNPAFGANVAVGKADFRFDARWVRRYLGIFQSSSPSYVLMAGMDRCVRMIEQDRILYAKPETRPESRFEQFEDRLREFYEKCAGFRFVQVFPYMESGCKADSEDRRKGRLYEQRDMAQGIFAKDNSKILISAQRAGLHGQQLYGRLLEKYHLQMEMAAGHYVTALTSIMDTEEGFARLYAALKEIEDAAIEREKICTAGVSGGDIAWIVNCIDEEKSRDACGEGKNRDSMEKEDWLAPCRLYSAREKIMELAEAIDAKKEDLPMDQSAGRISGEFVWLYPPGIPILVPGEVITEEVIGMIADCRSRHMNVQGMEDPDGERIWVLLS